MFYPFWFSVPVDQRMCEVQCRWSGRARVLEVIAVGRFVKTAIAIHLWTLHDRYWLAKMPSLGLRCVPKFPWKHCAAFPCWRISLDFDDIVMSCQSSIALSFQVLMSWATMLWLMLVPEPEMWRARTSNSRVPGRLCAQPRSWLVKSELCVPIWCCLQHIWYICASQSCSLDALDRHAREVLRIGLTKWRQPAAQKKATFTFFPAITASRLVLTRTSSVWGTDASDHIETRICRDTTPNMWDEDLCWTAQKKQPPYLNWKRWNDAICSKMLRVVEGYSSVLHACARSCQILRVS